MVLVWWLPGYGDEKLGADFLNAREHTGMRAAGGCCVSQLLWWGQAAGGEAIPVTKGALMRGTDADIHQAVTSSSADNSAKTICMH